MDHAHISSQNYNINRSFNINFSSCVGLPPPPPTQSLGSNVSPPGPAKQIPSGAGSQDQDSNFSSELIAVIALTLAMGIFLLVGFVWLILLRRSLNKKSPPSAVEPLHGYFSPKSEGVHLIQLNAYFNSKHEGVYRIHLKVLG